MIVAIGFVLAAGLGADLRAVAAHLRFGRRGRSAGGLPWGTVVVNLAGSFAYGLVAGWAPPAHTIAATGLLGSLTTYSTMCGEAHALWLGHRGRAAGYLATTVFGGIGLAWLGLALSS